MYKHFLITRFNLRVEKWETTKNGEMVLSEEWLQHRFKLFNDFCLPSIINQKNQNFTWLVYFDINTPDKYKGIVTDIKVRYKNFEPVFIDGWNAFFPSLDQEIKKRLTSLDKFVITSRLDNDDSVHRDYIDTVQGVFKEQKFCAVDIIDGYSLSLENEIKLGHFTYAVNPFLSLIEEVEGFKTVLFRKHKQWIEEKNRMIIRGKRLWLQVIHEKNKVNQYGGTILVNHNNLHRDFGVSEEVLKSFPKYNPITHFFTNAIISVQTTIHRIKRRINPPKPKVKSDS